MKIVTPNVEIMRTGVEKVFVTPEQFIEKVGRTCYKSEDKITDISSVKFVSNLINHGHEAMIEHWNLIFETDYNTYYHFVDDWNVLQHDNDIRLNEQIRPYIRFTDYTTWDGKERFVISGNMRAWRDYAKACVEGYNEIPNYMWGVIRNYPTFFPEYQDYTPVNFTDDILTPISITRLSKNERLVHQTITMKFICDRGVSHELVRHRVASFAQESTRYCNYGLDKFNNELTVVRPSWCKKDSDLYNYWQDGCLSAETTYFLMLHNGASPQEARSILPNSLKTEIIVTMNLDGWNHFFNLRCSSNAQPDMREIANMARELFEQEAH